jgi:chromosomal replication initiation ATPase DnaA
LEVGDEIAEYIARQVQANIRELEGALTTIYALATTAREPVTLELAQRALEGQIRLATRRISIMDIVEVVTKHFDVRLTDLQSKRRSQSITVPRSAHLARSFKHSLEEIAAISADATIDRDARTKIAERSSRSKMQTLLTELTSNHAPSPLRADETRAETVAKTYSKQTETSRCSKLPETRPSRTALII